LSHLQANLTKKGLVAKWPSRTFQKLRPLNLLAHLSSCYDSAHQYLVTRFPGPILRKQQIIYASHSVDPFDLDCHCVASVIKFSTEERSRQLRLLFETSIIQLKT